MSSQVPENHLNMGYLPIIIESHTPLEEVGKIAAEAGVKTLVLSHFVPAETPAVPDEVWLAGAKAHFSGEVILAKDLMEI
jgi:ribonuclease BN (tRNA processing enzyme)